jgi:hypothetical protein
MEVSDDLCEFRNKALSGAVRDAFAKLGIPTSGQLADITCPGPVKLIRLIRNPTGAHPRAVITVVWEAQTERWIVSVATHDGAGALLHSIQKTLDRDAWDASEPDAQPLAKPIVRAHTGGRAARHR